MASRQQALLEIETRDGDKVMLRFSDSWQFKSQSDGGGSQFSLKSSQSFDFSLGGISTVPRWMPSAPWSRGWTSWPGSSSRGRRQDSG